MDGLEQVDLAWASSTQAQSDDACATDGASAPPPPPPDLAAATSHMRQPRQRRRPRVAARDCRTSSSTGRSRRQRPRSAMARIGSGAEFDSTCTRRANRRFGTSQQKMELRQTPDAFSTQERVASDTLLSLSDGSKLAGVDAARAAWILQRSSATVRSEQRSLHYPRSAADSIEQEGQSLGRGRRADAGGRSRGASGGSKLNTWQVEQTGKKQLRPSRGSRDEYSSHPSQKQAVANDNTNSQRQQQKQKQQKQQPSSTSTSLPLRIEATRLRKSVHDLEIENEQLRMQCDSLVETTMGHNNAPPSRLTRAAQAHCPPHAAGGELVGQHCWQSLQMHSSLGCTQCSETLEEAAALGLVERIDIVSWDSLISANGSQRTLDDEIPPAKSSDATNWSGW